MNGIHDLGGMHNMGLLEHAEHEPVFHHDWERKVFSHAVALLGAGYFKLDEVRRVSEWMPPEQYLTTPYYEGWLFGVTALLLEKNIVTAEELEAGRSLRQDGGWVLPAFPKAAAEYVMNNPIPSRLEVDVAARFRPGDAIVTRNHHGPNHTRLPRYARGKRGVVEEDHGVFAFPDAIAHGREDQPQHLYSVRFSSEELWGGAQWTRGAVNLDLYDDYLDPLAP
jgi:nitrile hydratase